MSTMPPATRSGAVPDRVRAVKFGVWHPFAEASAAAPDGPGLLQARADALLPYPRGKSAMVLYAGTPAQDTLRHYVRDAGAPVLRRADACGARWVRFGETPSPERELARLLAHFQDRFGAPPAGNAETSPTPSSTGARTPNA
jgi:hypothetical protein